MKNPFQKSYTSEELSVFNFLSKVKLFSRLSPEEMLHFLPYLYLRKYKKDEVVFFRKDPSQAVYIIKEGYVSLLVDSGDTLEKINGLKRGYSFGNNALLHGTHRPYNAIVTSEEATLYVIPHVNIADIFNNNLKIKAKMLESLSELYHQYTLDLISSYQSAKGFFSMNSVHINF